MPQQKTIERARRARRAGKSPSTQAGEFVREQIRRIRGGEHGARSPEQAIAIGLSEARRTGVNLPPPKRGVKKTTRTSAAYDYEVGQGRRTPKRRPRVSRAVSGALKKEPRSTVSRVALSRHAKSAAARRKTAVRRARPKSAAKPGAPAGEAAARRPAARRPAPATKSRTRRHAPASRPAAKRSARHRRRSPAVREAAPARKTAAARKSAAKRTRRAPSRARKAARTRKRSHEEI